MTAGAVQDDRRRRVVVVVGVGRSGTSALTRGLQALGVELGPDLRPGAGKNPTGFFEDEALASIVRRVRKQTGLRAGAVGLIDPARWQSEGIRALHDEAVATIRERFGDAPLWGFKHARTQRVLPFWRDVFDTLQLDASYLVAVRNPLSVARSRGAIEARRGEQENSDLEWLANTIPHFDLVRARPFVVVDYDRLMADPRAQLERVALGLALPWGESEREAARAYGEDFLDQGRRHTRFSLDDLQKDPRTNPLTRDGYTLLHRLATDELARDSREFTLGWDRIAEGLLALAPVLRRLDDVEIELRRARKSWLGPLQNAPRALRKWREKRGRG